MKMSHIFDTVLHHDESVNTKPPGKTGILIWINICRSKYVRMNHTAANKLDPAFKTTNFTSGFLAERTAERELKTRLSKRKVKRIRTNFEFFLVIFVQKLL